MADRCAGVHRHVGGRKGAAAGLGGNVVVRRTRALVAAATAVIVVIAGGIAASSATADDPPIVWTPASGFPRAIDQDDDGDTDVTVSFETAISYEDPFGASGPTLDPTPIQRPIIVNESDHVKYFGFGIDIAVQGQIEHLWTPEAWGAISDSALDDNFVFTVQPGQGLGETGLSFQDGAPAYAGRTAVIYELSELPADGVDPVATELARYKTPGRFVPVRLADLDPDDPTVSDIVGREAKVAGPSATPELFPGVTGTVTASALPPSEALELWIAPNFDYLFFELLGGNLPADAMQVGTATTDAAGALSATFEVPSTAVIGTNYQLVAGVRAERYWPAGSYSSFTVNAPTTTGSVAVDGAATSADIPLGLTHVNFAFPAGTGGTWTATQSTTGPVPTGFSLAGSTGAQLFYHLDTTQTTGALVTVCIAYDTANIPGDPPRLYHFQTTPEPARWVDITTSRTPGTVCGVTSTFSPFTLGYPLDDGSKAKPAKGVLSSDNGWDTGLQDGDYNVVMDLWWGENARLVRLYENGALVGEKPLTRSTPNAQKATFPIAGKPNGTYIYKAELENSRGITTTANLTVKVTQANPAVPVLSTSGNIKTGTYVVTANLWWGTNATSYRFFEGATEVAAGALVRATPGAQSAQLTVVNKPKGTYVYTVKFANAAGETTSAPLTVKVTK